MQKTTLYFCGELGLLPRGRCCTFCTTDYEAAKAHEATHRGVTVQEYDKWLQLYKDVQDAGKNREIDDAHRSTFEQACALLHEFEEQHPAVSSVIPFEFRKEEP